MEGIQKEIRQDKKTITLIVENSNGDAEKIYSHNSNKTIELFRILQNASDELSGFHTAVRIELFNGF